MTDKETQVLDLIVQWGGIDGGHHKQWLLDQIVRALTSGCLGSDKGYSLWVERYQDGDEGPMTYEWDEGIAP